MKRWMIVSLVLLSVLTLTACNDNGNDNDDDYLVTITFWNIFTGPDGQEMVNMIDDFNAENEGVYRVNTQTIPANDFYDKLNTVVPQGQGPDVAIMHLDRIARYAQLGLLTSFDDLVEDIELNEEDYISAVWDAGIYDSKRYGIPLDVHPIGLYYNKDILDEYDVEVPTTTAELIAACDILNDPSIDQWCLPLSNMWPSQLLFQASLFQHDGQDMFTDTMYPAYNTQEGYDALNVLHELIYTHGVSPENVTVDEDLAIFRQGRAAFHINGIWMLNGIIDSGVNFGTASIETLFGDTPAIWAGSHNFVMPRPAKVNEDKQEAIMAFISYVSENSLRWANAGQIPANLTVLESQEYLDLPYHSTFANVDHIVFPTISPYFQDSFEPVFSRVTEAMSMGNADIQALLDEAETEGQQRVDEALGN